MSVGTVAWSRQLARSLTRRPLVFRVSTMSTEAERREERTTKMSSAMKMYLQRKRNHDVFIARERAEFEVGKEHLASMMGLEAASLTQEQIDQSIEYLFPSGLAKEARPVMKPPEEIFPRQKEAEFDLEGRPHHPFFYTLKPHLFASIFHLRDQLEAVTIFGERLAKQGKGPDPEQVLNAGKLADSRWLDREEVTKVCLENVSEEEYKDLMSVLERLTNLPFSYRVRDDIFKWRAGERSGATQQEFITPQFDEQGRAVVQFEGGQRKTAVANVKVTKPGTGKLLIKHREEPELVGDITYFYSLKDRHQLMYPLQFTKMMNLVDVECEVVGGGASGQAGAIRYSLAMCLRSFVDKETISDMKLVGLLTADIRVRERLHYGRSGARKAYTWKRR